MEGWDQRESTPVMSLFHSVLYMLQCHKVTMSHKVTWHCLRASSLSNTFFHLWCEMLSRIWLVWTNDHLWSKISLPAKESKINIIATRNEQSRQNRRPCHVSGKKIGAPALCLAPENLGWCLTRGRGKKRWIYSTSSPQSCHEAQFPAVNIHSCVHSS